MPVRPVDDHLVSEPYTGSRGGEACTAVKTSTSPRAAGARPPSAVLRRMPLMRAPEAPGRPGPHRGAGAGRHAHAAAPRRDDRARDATPRSRAAAADAHPRPRPGAAPGAPRHGPGPQRPADRGARPSAGARDVVRPLHVPGPRRPRTGRELGGVRLGHRRHDAPGDRSPPARRPSGGTHGRAALRRDDDVARWWDDHTVRDYTSAAKRIQHPTAGPLSFDIEIVCAPHEPDQRLVVYTAQPDSPTARVLPILASWNTARAAAS